MTDPTIEWYLNEIRRDLQTAKDTRNTGNYEFKINMKEGGIANMNCGKNKSVKKPE